MDDTRSGARPLPVDGTDDVLVAGTDDHQDDLRLLAERRDGDGGPFRLRVALRAEAGTTFDDAQVVVVGPHGRPLGRLPEDIAADVHPGLQLLASLSPPYVLDCEAVATHDDAVPDGDVRLTLRLDLGELARLTG